MNFGTRLKKSRIAKGFNQVEVAEKLGIDDTTISKYENNKSQPDNDILIRLAELYDVGFDYLYTGKLPENVKNPISEKDNRVLEGFHMLDEDEQGHVQNTIDMLNKKRNKLLNQ